MGRDADADVAAAAAASLPCWLQQVHSFSLQALPNMINFNSTPQAPLSVPITKTVGFPLHILKSQAIKIFKSLLDFLLQCTFKRD